MQPKLSKAAKRIAERERKLEEIRQQGREQVANGEVPDKAKIEDEMFEKQMNRMGKVIVKADADGHCMFVSMLHQFSILQAQFDSIVQMAATQSTTRSDTNRTAQEAMFRIIEASHIKTTAESDAPKIAKPPRELIMDLRRQIVGWLKDNKDQVIPYMTDDKGDMLAPEQFQEYCTKMTESAWGGAAELRALANILELPILIHMTDGTIKIAEELQKEGVPMIELSFHRNAYGLGEHYNSVCNRGLINV